MRPAWADDCEAALGAFDGPPTPDWSDTSVPSCSERCRYHDGKRCELQGRRPGDHCAPMLEQMAQMLTDARRTS